MDKPKQSAIERRVMAHLSPRYYNLFIGYMHSNEYKKCEAVNEIVKTFFNSIPENKKNEYLKEAIKKNKDNHSY
jgi:hypothetical protein